MKHTDVLFRSHAKMMRCRFVSWVRKRKLGCRMARLGCEGRTKKKLLVILGAGSSVSCGLPSVNQLDQSMGAWSRAWATQHSFPNFYEQLGQAIEAYYNSGGRCAAREVRFFKVRKLGPQARSSVA